MICAKNRLNTSHPVAQLQLSVASFDSTNKNVGNAKEQRYISLTGPGFSGSDCRQLAGSIRNNSGQSPLQFGFSNYDFVNQTGHKPFKCDVCQKLFRKSSSCQEHRRIHTGEKLFQCDMCGKLFRTSSNYQEHRRIHTGEKPFQCDICAKQFSTSTDYQKHRRIHTGEKPFQCDMCAKEFRTVDKCKRHRRVHTGEKPFKCEFCLKNFSDSSSYQRLDECIPMKSHSNVTFARNCSAHLSNTKHIGEHTQEISHSSAIFAAKGSVIPAIAGDIDEHIPEERIPVWNIRQRVPYLQSSEMSKNTYSLKIVHLRLVQSGLLFKKCFSQTCQEMLIEKRFLYTDPVISSFMTTGK